MNSIYDHLSADDQRMVARWRAIASTGAIAVLLAVSAVIAVLQPGDLPSVATQVATRTVN
jgi:anti-sigma-K factor RskA